MHLRVVDLVRDFDRAEQRPPAGFHVTTHLLEGRARPAIVMPVPARATWSLPLPGHGLFRAFVAMDPEGAPSTAVRFRFGVSDHRIYEGLVEATLTGARGGWTELRADLSAYAGFKWSLFYRPDRVTWHVVLATDAAAGSPLRAIWGAPEILTDDRSARVYTARRRQAR